MFFVFAESNLAPQGHLCGIIPNLIFNLVPQFMQYNFFIFSRFLNYTLLIFSI